MPRYDLRLAIASAGDAKELRELQQEADNTHLDTRERIALGKLAGARRQELITAAAERGTNGEDET